MPWTTNVICPFCRFKFGFDGRMESWTDNKVLNKKLLGEFGKVKQLAIDCPRCNKSIVHNFVNQKTARYDRIADKISPSLKAFFNLSLKLSKPLLKMGSSVIPERLTFEAFVDGQID